MTNDPEPFSWTVTSVLSSRLTLLKPAYFSGANSVRSGAMVALSRVCWAWISVAVAQMSARPINFLLFIF